MSDLVEKWFKDKKLTYHNIWECTDTAFEPGTYSWVLFFTAADIDPTYEYGIAGSVEEAEQGIKDVITTYLKNKDLL